MAKRFLEKIQRGKYEGVVSILTIMELMKAIRSICVEALGEYDHKTWKTRIGKLIEAIIKMKNIKLIEGNPTERAGLAFIKDLLYSEIAWEGYEIIKKYHGKPEDFRGEPRHKGLSCMDSLHVVLAKRVGCNRIATFDTGFEESRQEIDPIILQKDIW